MPNIKPYPLQDHVYDMSYQRQQQQQQQQHYSVYRPAYHRIPSTPAVTPRVSNWVSSMTPEVSPIVVPSMSAASVDFYQSAVASSYNYQQQYYRQAVVQSSNYHIVPIHHTLENSTITYDTVEQNFQKDLVKDVFFSPAMIHGREMSPSSDSASSVSSTCAHSDNESDDLGIIATPPYETPSSDLLLDSDVHLFDFGLDLATNNSNGTTTSSYEEVMMMAKNKNNGNKPAFSLSLKNKKFDFTQRDLLPTPPAVEYNIAQFSQQQNKRRCSDSVLQDRINKKQRQNMRSFSNNTPPTSPCGRLSTLQNDTIFESSYDYFEEASNEESEDEEHSAMRSSLEYNRFGSRSNPYLDTASEVQMHTVTLSDDDSFSTTSWEEAEDISSDIDEESASEEDEDFKAPVKYTPRKYNKKNNLNNGVHPLSKRKSCGESIDQCQTTTTSINDLFIDNANCLLPQAPPRPTSTPTIYQKLTKANIDWCRYCGTTEGVNWRPGPWGKRTLCNKHGCDYKGYGFACKLPRLDLTAFTRESIDERERPVLQLYCSGCQRKDSWEGNVLVRCEGCPKAFHQNCCPPTSGELSDEFVASKEAWFCDASCCENTRRKRIVVELPRKRLPLMCAPKSNSSSSASSVSSETSRPRRESSISSMK